MFGAKGNSLASLAKRYNLPDKGDEVVNMLGRNRESLSPAEFDRYAQYCLHDVELCYQLFTLLSEGWYDLESVDKREKFPVTELRIIDRIIRMYTEPKLHLNGQRLKEHLADVVTRKEELMSRVTVDKDTLMSNPKFATALQQMGVPPPMKISPTTGKETFAFAKTDPGMKALLDHWNPDVQALVAARLGVKSTLEETRTQRFIDMAQRDTLFPGGPGNTKFEGSSFDTIIESIDRRLLTLPADTLVLPGHGLDTTVGTERPHLDEWVARGW